MAFLTLQPKSQMTVSEWADEYRYLSPESSAEPGKYKTSRTPYLRGIMDAATDPDVHTIVVMTASQVGKSEALNNILFYFIHQDPCPVLMIQPTLTDAEDYSKSRIMASVRATPELDALFGPESKKQRSSSNTILTKQFPGGRLVMVGANSPSGLSSKPIRVVLADEISRYEVTKEGDAIELARQRQATFWNRLLVLTSTPGVKGVCPVERWYELSDKRKYFVPCAECGEYQVLKWPNVQWEHDENGNHKPETAMYACEHCGVLLTDVQLNEMVQRGEWRATAPFNGIAGFGCLPELYSPWRTMAQTVQSFLDSKDDPDLLRVWVNTKLGEAWEDSHEKVNVDMLWEKRENFSEVVPAEAGLLTAAVDVQADRLEVLVKGWGKNEESWDLEHLVIPGDPGIITDMRMAPGQMQFDAMAEPGGVWGKLYAYLQKEFDHESGGKIHVSAVAVDTGFKTDEALEFCWQCRQPKAFAVKGASIKEAPIVKRPSKSQAKGKKRKYNVPIFVVGVSTAKEVVTNRLSRTRGTGLIRVPERFGFEYFRQLTAEKKVRFKRAGRMVEEWRQTGRNEALDLEVYSLALLRILYPSMVILNQYIDAVLSKMQPVEKTEKPEVEPIRKPKMPVRRGGFVKSWKM